MKKVRPIMKEVLKFSKNFVKTRDFTSKMCYDTGITTNDFNERGLCSMYKAIDIAKHIITTCTKEGFPISNLQLQKILYYVQLHWLNKYGQPLFKDSIAAWQFGPVVPEVYYVFCGYGGTKIVSTYDTNINKTICNEIDPIVREKRVLYPWDLVGDTHREGGAWDKTFAKGAGDHRVIPISLLKKDSKT